MLPRSSLRTRRKNKLYQHSGTTNVAGQLTFQNLPLGLYLVSRTSSAKANKAYDCDPFLISIPGSGDTSADLNITVEPKLALELLLSRPKITRARSRAILALSVVRVPP